MTPKPGWETTEFCGLMLGFLLVSGLSIESGSVSYALNLDLAELWLVAAGGYSVSRGMSKMGAQP